MYTDQVEQDTCNKTPGVMQAQSKVDAGIAGMIQGHSEVVADSIKHAEKVKQDLAEKTERNDAVLAQLKAMDKQQRLANLFIYHAPTPEQEAKYKELRWKAENFAEAILRLVPDGADQSAALRKVREAVMTANAGIACNGKS